MSAVLGMQISEEVTYAVRQPTAHAINENHRVRCFRQMLLGPLDTPEQLMNLGDLMYQVNHHHTSTLEMPDMLCCLQVCDSSSLHTCGFVLIPQRRYLPL